MKINNVMMGVSAWWKRLTGTGNLVHKGVSAPEYTHPPRKVKKASRAKRHALWGWFHGKPVYANGTNKVFPGHERRGAAWMKAHGVS